MKVEYRLVGEDDSRLLNSEINKMLTQGWELLGQPFAAEYGREDHMVYQGMIKRTGCSSDGNECPQS